MTTTASVTDRRAADRDAVLARARIDVLFVRDGDDGLWHFCVGNPAILGGACRSREEAERRAAEAIAHALTVGRPHRSDDENAESVAFEVDIRLAEH